jgi:hypothetical protein
MEQQIQHMVAGRIVSIDPSIKEECGVQQWSHHMIEMADKCGPSIKMGIDEDRIEVIVLKGPLEGTDVGGRGGRDEKDRAE